MTGIAGAQRSLVVLRQGGEEAPVFFVHPSSGSVLCYLELARRLGAGRSLYGLEAAGLRGEALPLLRVEEMADRYLDAITAVHATGPCLLAGWSIGGMIAFEMARRLEGVGRRVALLAVLDSLGPAPGSPPPGLDEILQRFARDVASQAGAEAPALDGASAERPTGEKVAALARRLREAGLLSPEVDLRQVRARLAVFAANVRAAYAYAPGAWAGRAALFRAETSAPPDLGWEAYVCGGLAIRVVPGDHHTILRPPRVDHLAAELRTCVEAVNG